jgi:hypothetical protein
MAEFVEQRMEEMIPEVMAQFFSSLNVSPV